MWIKFICAPDKVRLSLRADFPKIHIRSVYMYVSSTELCPNRTKNAEIAGKI